MVENSGLIPNHEFGFRQRHSTIEHAHRIVQRINEALENKQYCSAAFLDISQAFDKVWHTGLLYKLRRSLPPNYFLILKSYLHSRHFLVKVETEYTELSSPNVGVPLLSTLLHTISYRGALLNTLLHAISYRRALLSTLLHATVYVYAQSAHCTSTDCK
jgi:hypothetical protein